MQRHQLLVTPPRPAGKRVKREMVVGSLLKGGVVVWRGLSEVGEGSGG